MKILFMFSNGIEYLKNILNFFLDLLMSKGRWLLYHLRKISQFQDCQVACFSSLTKINIAIPKEISLNLMVFQSAGEDD